MGTHVVAARLIARTPVHSRHRNEARGIRSRPGTPGHGLSLQSPAACVLPWQRREPMAGTSAHPAAAAMDCSPPRQVNGQAVILRSGRDGRLEVLLQRRSDEMPVMPGFLGSVGGMRDRTDPDSRHTALREVHEETGLVSPAAVGPAKFAQGARCDWYVMLLESPQFVPRAPSHWELGDIERAMPFLPASAARAECYGHAWVPVDCLVEIDGRRQPLMTGLLHRVGQAVQHLRAVQGGCAGPVMGAGGAAAGPRGGGGGAAAGGRVGDGAAEWPVPALPT